MPTEDFPNNKFFYRSEKEPIFVRKRPPVIKAQYLYKFDNRFVMMCLSSYDQFRT